MRKCEPSVLFCSPRVIIGRIKSSTWPLTAHSAVFLLANLPTILPRHPDRLRTFLWESGVVHDPANDLTLLLHSRQHGVSHLSQYLFIAPGHPLPSDAATGAYGGRSRSKRAAVGSTFFRPRATAAPYSVPLAEQRDQHARPPFTMRVYMLQTASSVYPHMLCKLHKWKI